MSLLTIQRSMQQHDLWQSLQTADCGVTDWLSRHGSVSYRCRTIRVISTLTVSQSDCAQTCKVSAFRFSHCVI